VAGNQLPGGGGVTSVEPTDEFLPAPDLSRCRRLAETSLFGFNVPEQNLNCTIRHRLHPVLGLVSGGVVLIRGQVENAAFADFVDYRNFMPMTGGSLDDVLLPNGVRLRVVEPLRRIDLSYASPNGRLRFECSQEAIMPAASEPGGNRFTQAMATAGELVLDGERIEIDGYCLREHSWTALGEEDDAALPLGWAGAVFGPDLAFHFSAQDGRFLDSTKLRWGYVWRDGETRPLDAAWMRTGRAADGAAPTGVEVRLRDATGETYELAGETRARAPINLWPNMIDQACLMRYRLNGRCCYGDFQDFQCNSFLRTTRA
jgi:hypothetical protein